MVKNATIKQIQVYTFKKKHEKDKYIDMIN